MILLATADEAHQMLLTLVAAIASGSLLIVVARRFNIPGIVLLLAGGVLLGPEMLGFVQPDRLGDGLRVIVALAIGLILFEGGLTLDLEGYRSAPVMIKRLLTVGVIVTWAGAAGALKLVFPDLQWSYVVICGSLVIVTGPTVIAPLLKRIKVNARLHSILHWEGVLIDPIGVFIAVLCFEWISGQTAIANLGIRVAAGLGVGIPGGLLISVLVRRKIVPEDLVNVFALGFAVLVFGVAEVLRPEAGLLSVTVAGFIFGLTGPAKLKEVRRFKADLTDLLIGMLFILLAARLEFSQFVDFGLKGVAVVAMMMLLVRPISVMLCAFRVDLTLREKGFLSWVAPRGIVAASMASLFSIRLEDLDRFSDPRLIETFTYSVIVATIVIQGSTAGAIASVWGLRRATPRGWMIVGAHAFGVRLAQFLARAANVPVVLVDTNQRLVRDAGLAGVKAVAADAREATLSDREELQLVGHVLALTDNEDLNARVAQTWGEVVGFENVFRCNTGGVTSVDEEPEDSGTVIWRRLPKPSLVSAELQRGEARPIESNPDAPDAPPFASAIVAVIDGNVTLDPPDTGEAPTLYLDRPADYIGRAIRSDLIWRSETGTRDELFAEAVDKVVDAVPTLRRDQTIEELRDREASFPTALGHGVAVPHAYATGLDSRICAIVQTSGIDFEAPDGAPVTLVFLLLSPPGDPEGHLATLAEIARLVANTSIREALNESPSATESIRVVREAPRRVMGGKQ